MTADQITLFALLLLVFAFLIWGRWRYDVVAFCALMVGLVTGVVPTGDAFSGFGHPATVIIAMVLIVSRGLSNSGAIDLVANRLIDKNRKPAAHIGILSSFAAALSAVMNNVAALALLMPIDLKAAAKAKRSPALTLMPLSFASILGGMITLIGTPPNIIVAEFRNDALDEPYGMFDFAPVGLICAVLGVLYVATVGWRLIPKATTSHDSPKELFAIEEYIAEVKVPEGSKAIGVQVRELDDAAEENDVTVLGLVRRGKRLPWMARMEEIRKGDVLVLEAQPDGIEGMVKAWGLEYSRGAKKEGGLLGEDLSAVEVVVPEGALIAGRSAYALRLLYRHGVTLLGVSRQGRRFTERVRKLTIEAGDVLLLLGPDDRLPDTVKWLGCLPLAERGLEVTKRGRAGLAVGIFAAAVGLASAGVLYLPVALACAAAVLVLTNIVPLRQLYDSVEWPVIVLLGSMIPIGVALESTGCTALIANGIVDLAGDGSPVFVLTLLVVVTMTLSDVMNNTATAVIAAPIGLNIATRLEVSPDPFLMGVAVAASCAFLTPIGHKNNTLILGPGGYRFGDYWRMGLPLEILIIAVSVPSILVFWPL